MPAESSQKVSATPEFKFVLSSDDYEKIEDSHVAISSWIKEFSGISRAKVSSGLKYAHKRSAINRLLQKPKTFAIRSVAVDEVVAQRSLKDFTLLRQSLVKRFTVVLLPPVPKSPSKSAMGIFLGYILRNPFLRCDTAVTLFLDDSVVNFGNSLKHAFRKNKIKSQGNLRWLQAVSSYPNSLSPDFKQNQVFFAKLKTELKRNLKHIKALEANVKQQMGLQESQALIYSDLTSIFQSLVASESNLSTLDPGSNSKPATVEAGELSTVSSHNQATLFRKHYGSPMLQKKILEPLTHQIDLINQWLKHITSTEAKAKTLSYLITKVTKTPVQANVSDKTMKSIERIQKEVCMTYQGLFGLELGAYRVYRVSQLSQVQEALSSFHLLGAEKTYDIWDRNQPIFRTMLDEYDLKEVYRNKKDKVTLKKLNKTMISEEKFDPHVLEVKSIPNGKKWLKVEMEETVVGHKMRIGKGKKAKDAWLVVRACGGKGFLPMGSVHVKGRAKARSESMSAARRNSTAGGRLSTRLSAGSLVLRTLDDIKREDAETPVLEEVKDQNKQWDKVDLSKDLLKSADSITGNKIEDKKQSLSLLKLPQQPATNMAPLLDCRPQLSFLSELKTGGTQNILKKTTERPQPPTQKVGKRPAAINFMDELRNAQKDRKAFLKGAKVPEGSIRQLPLKPKAVTVEQSMLTELQNKMAQIRNTVGADDWE